MDIKNEKNLLIAIEKLGWHLTDESIELFLQENNNLTSNDLVKLALDCDLRNIGAKHLPDGVSGGRNESFDGPCVLQLVKLRNIGAPKENETSTVSPAMYKITLTDGTSNCNALAIEDVNKLNLNTPPGTKILLKGHIKIKSNLLIIDNQSCQILGGHVEYLVNKWKTNKELSQHVRTMNLASAPPPWVPFGTRQVSQVDTSKKVFAQNEKPEEETNSEFSQARQAALAEAMEAKLKINKTFITQTIDKSQIAASTPTQFAASSTAPPLPVSRPQGKGRGGRKNKNLDDDENDYRDVKDAAKPVAVTLFDLVKNKLDIKEPEPEVATVQENANFYENQRDQRRETNNRRNNRRGGGGGRFQDSSSRFQTNQSTQSSSSNKQVYDKDDFSYDLGDTTDPKLVKQNKAYLNSLPKQQEKFVAKTNPAKPVESKQNSAQAETRPESKNAPTNNENSNEPKKTYPNKAQYNTQPETNQYNSKLRNYNNNQANNDYSNNNDNYNQNRRYNKNNNDYNQSNYQAQSVIYSQPQYAPENRPSQVKNAYYPPNQNNYYNNNNNDYYQPPPLIPVPPQSQPYYANYATQNQHQQYQNNYYPNENFNNNNNNTRSFYNSNQKRNKDFNNSNNNRNLEWNVGDNCLAKYHDNKFYPAIIQSINSNRCVVSYFGYNEQIEVNLNEIRPNSKYSNKNNNNAPTSASN